MNVLIVEPGYLPYEKEIGGLDEMEAVVGGPIESIYPFTDFVGVVCNLVGLLNGAVFNRSMPDGYGGVFGTFFICGLAAGTFCSLTPQQIEKYKQYFCKAERLVGVNGYELKTIKYPAEKKPEEGSHEQKHSSPEC